MKLWPFTRAPRFQFDAKDAENAVVKLLSHFPNAEGDWDEEQLLKKMTGDGMDEKLSWILIGLVPIYAGRILMQQAGLKFSDKVDLLHANGRKESHLLANFIPWRAILTNSARIRAHPNFKAMALSGPEVSGVNKLLNTGSQPANIRFTPPLLFIRG